MVDFSSSSAALYDYIRANMSEVTDTTGFPERQERLRLQGNRCVDRMIEVELFVTASTAANL